jgi:Fic-DOC domain mobile mystery protein B
MMPFDTPENATPVEDVSGLIPTHITTKEQLNEWEVNNILKAAERYLTKRVQRIITVDFIKKVHKDMFDDSWEWAGQFRKRDLSIGIDWHKIQIEVKKLADDIEFWRKGKSDLNIFEQSVRMHHRLVKIHPFLNGNGRHARMIADIFLFSCGHKMPIWPSHEIISSTDIRKRYISALNKADKNDYRPLEKFTKEMLPKI